ncbi:hypothetical protein Ancab_030553 [Ancistrocladus abbreviatus]
MQISSTDATHSSIEHSLPLLQDRYVHLYALEQEKIFHPNLSFLTLTVFMSSFLHHLYQFGAKLPIQVKNGILGSTIVPSLCLPLRVVANTVISETEWRLPRWTVLYWDIIYYIHRYVYVP